MFSYKIKILARVVLLQICLQHVTAYNIYYSGWGFCVLFSSSKYMKWEYLKFLYDNFLRKLSNVLLIIIQISILHNPT